VKESLKKNYYDNINIVIVNLFIAIVYFTIYLLYNGYISSLFKRTIIYYLYNYF